MDSSKPRTALLVGATGAVGSRCLEYLLESPFYSKVIVLTRFPLALEHPKLEKQAIDFDRLSDYKNRMVADDVFCSLGLISQKAESKEHYYKVDVTYPHQIAQSAREQGAERFFLVSSMGANPQAPFFYWRIKGEAEERVSSVPFRSVRIFRPALIVAPRREFRPNEFLAVHVFKFFPFLLSGKFARYRPIEASLIARAMVRSAVEDGGSGKKIYESPEIRKLAEGGPAR